MRKRPWGIGLLVVGGVVIGVAIAGVPSRGEDPPLRLDATETTTTALPTTTTTVPATTTVLSAPSTTRPRR